MTRRGRDFFWIGVRLALAVLFIAASYYKIQAPGAFAHQIYNYKILPVWAINPAAIVLPWLQLFVGVALLFNGFVKGASLWALIMVVLFQAAVASALVRDLNIACGCFKSGGSPATWWTFARDSVFLLLAALQAYRAFKPTGSPGPSFKRLEGL